MLFTRIEFLCLMIVVLGLQLLVRRAGPRKSILLAASYYFYAYWDWRFLSLILFSTGVDWLVARGIRAASSPGRRKRLLLVSLVANLGLLATFKYMGFFAESFEAVFGPLLAGFGFTPDLTLLKRIVLPVGISFYTFQTLSYTIDVYRGRLAPCDSFRDFALFVAFFPQLVAGPIVRAAHFLPQLADPAPPTRDRFFAGFTQFTTGFFKKVFIADRLAAFVDPVFAGPSPFDGPTLCFALLCYTVQIYCDFAGYSDMAIGVARMLGFDLNENFDHPYLARSFADFWRRWHISLSTWLRDYLYIPLGGSRKGPSRTYVNLMLTMLLGGLWHGADWTFVIWGGINGVALAVERALRPRLGPRLAFVPAPLRTTAGWAITLLVVVLARVFFRAQDFTTAWTYLGGLSATEGIRWIHPFSVFAVVIIAATHALQLTRFRGLRDLPDRRFYTPVAVGLMWWLVLVFPARGFTPFIYFQF